MHQRKPFTSPGDGDTTEQHGGSPTISERPRLKKSDSHYNDTHHFHDSGSPTISERPGLKKSDSHYNDTHHSHGRLSFEDKIRNTDWLQIEVHKTENCGGRVAVRNYGDSETASKFCTNTDQKGKICEKTQQSSRKMSQNAVCEAYTVRRHRSEDISPRKLYYGQSEREYKHHEGAEISSCKQSLSVNDERISAQKLHQCQSENEHKYQINSKNLCGQKHSKNDNRSERSSVRKLYQRQSESKHGPHNHGELSFSRLTQSRKDSRSERIYANIAQKSNPEYQQNFDIVSPKASVQTQTPKSYTKEVSRERKYARESETQFQNLERSFGNGHERHTSPTKCKSGLRIEPVGRAEHISAEVLSPSKLISNTSINGSGLRDNKLISPNNYEVSSKDNRREAQFRSSQRHQGDLRRENYKGSALSSPSLYLKTAQTDSRDDTMHLTSKQLDSYDTANERTTYDQFKTDRDRSRSEDIRSRSSKFISQKQQVHSKKINYTDQVQTPKPKLFNGAAKPTEYMQRNEYRKGQDFSIISPRRLDNHRHCEVQSERYAKERVASNIGSLQYCKTSTRSKVKDYEHDHNDQQVVSPSQYRVRQCDNKSKNRSAEHSNKPGRVEQQRDLNFKSPNRCEEKMRNSQLISPIQERFKTRSEVLTAENLDMLNQSFNDSYINISQNQSALNVSMAEENKEKISQWLDMLESSEEALNDVCFPKAVTQSHETKFEPRGQGRIKQDKQHNMSHLQNQSEVLRLENEFQKSDVEKFTSSNEDISDIRVTKPPSKRFKVSNKDDTFDIHKPSTGYIAKANAQSVHHRFKGMTNKELKAFLTSDDSGVSTLVSIKPKQAYMIDTQQNKFNKHSSKAVVSENTYAPPYEQLGFSTNQQEQGVSEECTQLCSCNNMSKEVGRNSSPKVQTRDRTSRKAPYSASSRALTPASSAKSVTRDCHETNISRDTSSTYSVKQIENQDISRKYNRYSASSKEYDKRYNHRKDKRHDFAYENEEHLTTQTSYEEGVIGHTSLSEDNENERQERQNYVKHSDNFTDTDTASLHEYCEEGGHESCSCDDIENRHENLYESFESVDGPDIRSPKVQFKLRSPYAYTPSNTRTPDLQSSCRTRSKDCQNDNQESPSVSMAKLKLNTPQSRRHHLVNSPLADSGGNRISYLESQKSDTRNQSKSLPNHFNSDITDRDVRHVQQKSANFEPMRNSQIQIRNSGTDIETYSNTEGFTIEQGDSEKENYKQVSVRSNNQKTKSKKSLFTVVGKTSTANEMAMKPNCNFETDNCFKLPISPFVQKRPFSAASKRNLTAVNEKQIAPSEIKYQSKPNVNRFGERVNTGKPSDRSKDSEQRGTKPVSQTCFSARPTKPYLQRPVNRFTNQFEYAQSTPVHPGIRLSLNETFSTILGSEETEMEHEDEVMLIDD